MLPSSSPEPVAWLRGHRSTVSCLAFLEEEEGDGLVSGDCGGDLILWSLRTKRIVKLLAGEHEGGVLQVLSSAAMWFSQGRMDGNLKQWSPQGELTNVFRLQTESFCKAVIVDGDEGGFKLVCTKATDASVVVMWDSAKSMRQPSLEYCTEDKSGMVMCVALEAAMLLAGYEDGHLRGFNVETAECLFVLCVQPDYNPCTSFVYCPGTNKGLAAGASGEMTLFQLVPAKVVKHVPVLANKQTSGEEDKLGKGVGQLCLRPDTKILAAACWDHRLRIFHWQTLKPLAVLKNHRDSVQCLAFSNNSQLLASGSKDRNIAIWRIYS
ncbi:hypothetical protein BASA81_006148 [Batrachochytrium salamandrivorans]|nr:hypothetical protein BASA81_006148 [Batrachochytrium salamandrivorans]